MQQVGKRTALLYFVMLTAATGLFSCATTKPIEFRTIRNITVDMDNTGQPLLRGEAVLYNPNKLRMKLKEVRLQITLDGKKSASVDQKPNQVIPAVSEFPVFVEAHLSLNEQGGLMNTMLDFFGGKRYQVLYTGFVRVRVHGVRIKIPVEFKNELRLK